METLESRLTILESEVESLRAKTMFLEDLIKDQCDINISNVDMFKTLSEACKPHRLSELLPDFSE